jgi:uncharacterized membrane protein YbaN (DUF454 family)
MTPSTSPKKGHPLTRPLFFVLGLILTGIGIVNIVIPGLPTTIFLILAAACFARSSARLESWLVNHPRFGPSVTAWRETKAIPRKVKYVAIGSMALSFVIVLLVHVPLVWTCVIAVAMLACALFIVTRPDGPKAAN